ncbi:MAG: efflux RND transporter permease subunit [Saprospiraceae bacterium]|nr:efflux RND transporter permease subunit [Saprospiraceae bacterium]
MEILKDKLREFGLSSFAVDNATSIFLVSLMIFLFGISSYTSIPKEQFPEASLPTVYINTPYFGNSAEEIENLISRPLEKEIESISGLKKITSTSIQDFSVMIAEFDADLEIEDAVRKVKDAVDTAKPELPNDLDQEPTVLEIKFSDIPIVTINVSGDYGQDELREYAEYIQDKVEVLKEINKVDLKGALEREVQINVDLNKMQSLQVSFNDIQNAVSSENLTMSGGEIVKNGFRRALRVIGQFDDVEEMRKIIVKSENQRPIVLEDIAEVKYTFEDRTSYARSDGFPVISLDVIKRRGQNLLSAADKIKIIVEDAAEVLPEDLKISLFNDQSENTRNEVNNLENSIISGVILVVLVLLFFLGLRNASFVGLAIPLSMLMGILFLNLTGTTLNIVVLFSLILALGLLVDNAIVVVENIYRYMQNGYNGVDAAKYGAGEVAMPIIASTATTLAAFLPLAVWPGIVGEFMKYMPITLIIVLASSLFVALVINPVFTSTFMRVDEQAENDREYSKKVKNVLLGAGILFLISIGGVFTGSDTVRNFFGFALILVLLNFFILRPMSFGFQNKVLPILENTYNVFITWVLKGFKPYLIFFGTFVLLFLVGMLVSNFPPKTEFFPTADPLYVNTFVELPQGVDIKTTNEIVKEVEADITNVLKGKEKVVEAVLTQIGENTSDPNEPPSPGVTPNKARITVTFVPSSKRGGVSTKDIMNDIRKEVIGKYSGVQIIVAQNANGPPAGKPINLEIKGDDIDSLIVLSDRVLNFMNTLGIGGIEELKKDVQLGKPELLINIDREAARRYELSTYSIASALRTSVFGSEVSKFKQGEDEYPIMVRLSEDSRNDINKLMNQRITFRNPANGRIVQVPISSVADYEYSSTYNNIRRKDGERVVTIFSNLLDGYNANEVVAELQSNLDNYEFPEGYTFEFTGEQQQQAEDMEFLGGAFIFALFLIFIIIVAQFNSIISPFIILLSILFSTIGVMLGYFFSGMTYSIIFSSVGIISLAGVVVNNAIVLIDYINLLIKRKRESMGIDSLYKMEVSDIKSAIIQGGATRLRPVLLTAITTILGLIPLALGVNFNFFTLITDLDPQYFRGGDNTALWGPMSWTIIYGLTFATFLTLVVVPVMYYLAYKIKLGTKRLFSRSAR